jgi:O-antigen/teichoic acid export membrane protein
LLQLMCLAAVPHCVVVMVAAWARGRQRVVLAVLVSIAEYVAMIGFALLFVGRMGVMGFGWAWLAGETLAAVLLAGVAWRTRHIDLALVRNAVTARRVPNAAA